VDRNLILRARRSRRACSSYGSNRRIREGCGCCGGRWPEPRSLPRTWDCGEPSTGAV